MILVVVIVDGQVRSRTSRSPWRFFSAHSRGYVGTNLLTDRICRLGAESADCQQIRPTKTSLQIRLASSADSPNVSADSFFKCSVCRFDPKQTQNLQTRLRPSWNESADESNLQTRKQNLQIRSALVGTDLRTRRICSSDGTFENESADSLARGALGRSSQTAPSHG